MTWRDLIQLSLQELGVYSTIDTIRSEDETYARNKLNLMLDEWGTRKVYAYAMLNQAFTFSASQQSYSLGYTANAPDFTLTSTFGSERPVKIHRAKVVLTAGSPDSEIEIPVINVDQYASLNIPAQSSSIPTKLYYQPTFPNGTLFPWPYPTTTTNQLKLYFWQQVKQVAESDLTTDISLPEGYKNAILLSLAEEMTGPPFGAALTPELERRARRARANIQSLNSEPPLISTNEMGNSVHGRSNVGFITRWQ